MHVYERIYVYMGGVINADRLIFSKKINIAIIMRGNHAVADPGFPPGGCANSQNCYYFSNFCQKLHENERIWTPRRGARPWRPP